MTFGPDYEGSGDAEFDVLTYVELSAFDGLVSISLEGAKAVLPLGESGEDGRNEDDNDGLKVLSYTDDSVIGSGIAIAALDETQVSPTFAQSLGDDVEGYTIDLAGFGSPSSRWTGGSRSWP